MAVRIVRPDTAFADSGTRTRRPRVLMPSHLDFIRGLRCLVCGRPAPSEAAHLRMADPRFAKRAVGAAEKPDDRWTLPLCGGCHRTSPGAQHNANEAAWWLQQGIDAVVVAAALYAFTGDEESAELIMRTRGVRTPPTGARKA